MNTFTLKKPLFGDFIEFIIFDTDSSIEFDILDAYDEGLRLQKIFNFYDKKSELSKLNSRRKLKVSDELKLVIEQAIVYSKKNQNYDVTKGKQFLEQKKKLSYNPVDCSYKDILIEGNVVTLLNKDVSVDLGSIAKGFIVDKIFDFINSLGIESGIINGRGDIVVFGKPQIVGVQNPHKDEILFNIKIQNQAIATSGDYNQKNHIVNGKLSSVTVIANDLMTADVFATVISVSSEEYIQKLIKENIDIKVLTIDKQGKMKYYNCFEDVIVREV